MEINDTLCINTIRALSIDAIIKANSGHPGLPLGAAPMAYVLWKKHLRHSPQNPLWPNRDRFVLSAGHGSMLLYSLLHLFGYDLPLEEIKNFRQWGSKTPGHPEFGLAPGVEATTGPLGQGAANAVGMAIAERKLAQLFGADLVDHFTYALVSDGDLMEGVSAEAASLAGHLKLGKLIYLYDANQVTLDGPTSLAFSTENLAMRYQSYGWQVLTVENGDTDLSAIDAALVAAKKETTQPSIIIVNTTIGFGSPKAGTSSVHGSPLSLEEIKTTKKNLGYPSEEPFFIPSEVRDHLKKFANDANAQVEAWNKKLNALKKNNPILAEQWELAHSGKLPSNWESLVPGLGAGAITESSATRQSGGKVMNAIAAQIPWLIGGDADLGCSTNTVIKDGGSFEGQTGTGRNIHYGVREHAMASIANGICYHGGVRPFVATFFCFADYMRPAFRLAAMNHLNPIYVWTHDSIGLGEDGPTHQPVEHLMSLRVIPGLRVLRPADANEAAMAWKLAIETPHNPVGIVLSRQKLPTFDRSGGKQAGWGDATGVLQGAYVLKEAENSKPTFILIATGSEVALALEAQSLLAKENLHGRVVSMPSWEIFASQPKTLRDSVLPPHLTNRVSIEAGVTLGWEKWIGPRGVAIGVDRYGASAPAEKLLIEYGLTAQNIVRAVKGHS